MKSEFKMDLHIHTTYSNDGSYTPKEIINMAKLKNINVIAVSDHNSVKGIEEAIFYGYKELVFVIPAIEIDCTFENKNFHVLGYFIDYKNDIFRVIQDNIKIQEMALSKKRVNAIEKLGIFINIEKLEALSKDGVITGEMIAEASIYESKNKKNTLIKPYLDGGSKSDNPFVNFYWDFCSQGKPAYIPIKYPSMTEIVKIIENTGGISVLAHPGKNIYENEELLNKIVKIGIKGIEVYSSYHNTEQEKFYNSYAEKNNIIATCGSDFHGKTKPSVEFAEFNLENDDFNKIYNKLLDKIKVL